MIDLHTSAVLDLMHELSYIGQLKDISLSSDIFILGYFQFHFPEFAIEISYDGYWTFYVKFSSIYFSIKNIVLFYWLYALRKKIEKRHTNAVLHISSNLESINILLLRLSKCFEKTFILSGGLFF